MDTSVEISPAENPGQTQMRSVVMTLNNYTPEEYDYIKLMGPKCKYLIVAKEIAPTTGTQHLQMSATFTSPKTLSAIKKFFKTQRISVRQMRGTHQQASDYCRYSDYPLNNVENNEVIEYGTLPHQGQRTDWVQVIDDLSGGLPVRDVIRAQPHLLPFIRSIQTYQNTLVQSYEREVKVHVLYGDAGTGKTRYCYNHDPLLYSKPTGEWWNGYTGQTTLLLDDYYGYITHADLLHILDRYPRDYPIKGGFVGARWTTVFITSNKSPAEWYSKFNEMQSSLRRRITTIRYLEQCGVETRWYDVDKEDSELTYTHTTHSITGAEIPRISVNDDLHVAKARKVIVSSRSL